MGRAAQLSPVDLLIQQAARLSRGNLLDLQSAINALTEATEPTLIDLESERKERRGNSKPAPKGWIEEKKVRGCGPYRYLRYWSDGKKKSTYLGKVAE
jgi:hypothetical protein